MDIRNTAVLSFFLDPPENPLREDGAFAQADTGLWQEMRKEGGSATNTSPVFSQVSMSYWTRDAFSGDVEVFGCSGGGQLGAALEDWRLGLFTFVGGYKQVSGYSALFGGGISKSYSIRRHDDGVLTPLVEVAGTPYPNLILLRTHGTDVEFWRSHDDGENWVMECSATDPTYRTGFFLALGIEEQSVSGDLGFSCFGGGKRNRTQIYRWLGRTREQEFPLTPAKRPAGG